MVQFGNGAALGPLADDARTLDAAAFIRRHGDAFLLLDTDKLRQASAEQRTRSLAGPGSPAAPVLVYPVRRRLESTFEFVSVGRHENNDVHLPEASISRFHAFFRPQGGALYLQDAGSQNGTKVDDAVVPGQKEGAAVLVKPGAHVAFGDVHLSFLDGALFIEITRNLIRG